MLQLLGCKIVNRKWKLKSKIWEILLFIILYLNLYLRTYIYTSVGNDQYMYDILIFEKDNG